MQGQPAKHVRANTVTANKKIRNRSSKYTDTHELQAGLQWVTEPTNLLYQHAAAKRVV